MVKQPNALSITLTFSSETETDEDYDFIYIYDREDNLIGIYTGKQLASKTITVAGDTVKIRLVSDDSMTYYGFAVTDVTVKTLDETVVRGDVNGDGTLPLGDAMQAFYHVNQKKSVDAAAQARADVTGDGGLTLADALKIFYFVNEKISTL